MAGLTELHCSHCQRVETFEQPECSDRHGTDCPDWVCVTCGTAVFAGLPLSDSAPTFRAGSPLRRTA